MKRLVCLSLVFVGVLCAAPTARAYRCLRVGCPAWCGPVAYRMAGASEDLEALGAGTSEAQLRQAMDDWTRVPCSSLETLPEASTTAPIESGDGLTSFGWVETDWPFDANAIGITEHRFSVGCIVEADVWLNGENYTWTTGPGSGSRINAYGTLVHESGHVFGLGHSETPFSVMWFLNLGGTSVLQEDDFSGICSLYTGGPGDCAVTGCPLGYACEAGACELSEPPGCTRHEECAPGERCDPVSGGCVDGEPAGEALGAPCVDDLDCASGACARLASGSVCTEPCDGLAPRAAACPDGFYCDGDAAGVCGTGLCLAGQPGDAGLGGFCEEDSDCASNMCDGARCATPCDPDIGGGCPDGFVCEPGVATGCGACKPPLAIGARCRFNEDCADGLCLAEEAGATGVCTVMCSGSDACPVGFACVDGFCAGPAGGLRGGGCAVGARRDGSGGALVLVLVGLLAVRRRM